MFTKSSTGCPMHLHGHHIAPVKRTDLVFTKALGPLTLHFSKNHLSNMPVKSKKIQMMRTVR
jgi:hypothetical protein